jgi:transposase
MTTAAARNEQEHTPEATLFVAFELSEKTWKLGFTTGHGQKPRERTVTARPHEHVLNEIAAAKRRFGLPETASVVSCDEAGREGLWLHRFWLAHRITNPVVDSSALAVSRRQRRAQSDGLDVRKLLSMLMRSHQGERHVWQVVKVPAVEAEAQRHLHRGLATLKQERASTTTRLKGLLSRQGIRLTSLTHWPDQLDALRLWDGSPMPLGLRHRILRVYAHHTLLSQQIAEVEAERRTQLQTSSEASIAKVRQLMRLKGIGINGAWLVVMEFFGWRAFKHRREVGGVAGFTPTPDQSGESAREQGITTSGNRHVRWMTTELAWSWLRFQPDRTFSCWFRQRCGNGGKRVRRIGMVAVARKLLIALWRFLETGEVPEGAALKVGEALEPDGVTPRRGCWWREPVVVQGLLGTPLYRWGRLLWPASWRRTTQKVSGDGRASPHGEQLVGDLGSQRQRKPPAQWIEAM